MSPVTEERERILAIIRDRIRDIRTLGVARARSYDHVESDGKINDVDDLIEESHIEALDDLLDEIAMKSGLTAADVRVPGGSRA